MKDFVIIISLVCFALIYLLRMNVLLKCLYRKKNQAYPGFVKAYLKASFKEKLFAGSLFNLSIDEFCDVETKKRAGQYLVAMFIAFGVAVVIGFINA